MKINDVFDFKYKESVVNNILNPYDCFDGQLTLVKNIRNEEVLIDSYWSLNRHLNHEFTIDEAQEKGYLEFKCNLDEVEFIEEQDLLFYNDKDVINLSRHGGSLKRFAVKKGSKKSKEKILSILNEKKEFHQNHVNSYDDKIRKIQAGVSLEDIYIE